MDVLIRVDDNRVERGENSKGVGRAQMNHLSVLGKVIDAYTKPD